MTRRLVALLASGLLLHLNVLGVERTCEPEHDQPAAQVDHSGHSSHTNAPAPPQDAAQKCCTAMSACATSLELGAVREIAATIISNQLVSPATEAAHGAASRAPEPPPPRTEAA